ncbi:pyruvate, water dikinase regulatory protein [Candidatus Oleimmundimicrobium sp.]|uniref:pyruvate, water dikinase regulatory protein n=1 Tax=Candidatus Oleimmundimicrobium sp. TaxID=3060597 RepID=UPI00271E4588|nr:pyruvate, water dikinase regulatory protein [Candidatus Oleimmundimicrobium sp.]MDO8885832.1 pyruvate, water dikinase regulatory protein [Candidatus Oleimmundimicrobium sp.]
MTVKRNIYVLSDSLGDTAEQLAKAATSQFAEKFKIVKWPKIDNEKQIETIISKAKVDSSVIFYSLVIPRLKEFLEIKANEYGVSELDILGPAIKVLEDVLEITAESNPGASRKINNGYFRKIEAMNFAVKHDDGRGIENIKEAEIVLIGVSRTSKTPLSMFLAYHGLKAANIPLIYGIEPAKQLFEIPSEKIIGLDIDANLLREIRGQRLESVGSPKNGYADIKYIFKELECACSIMKKLRCKVINITHKAIEETASEILKYYSKNDNYI